MTSKNPTTTEEVRAEIIRLATANLPAGSTEAADAAVNAVRWFDAWLRQISSAQADPQPTVTRVEVIDGADRAFVKYGTRIEMLSYQDDNRTLKIFLQDRR